MRSHVLAVKIAVSAVPRQGRGMPTLPYASKTSYGYVAGAAQAGQSVGNLLHVVYAQGACNEQLLGGNLQGCQVTG